MSVLRALLFVVLTVVLTYWMVENVYIRFLVLVISNLMSWDNAEIDEKTSEITRIVNSKNDLRDRLKIIRSQTFLKSCNLTDVVIIQARSIPQHATSCASSQDSKSIPILVTQPAERKLKKVLNLTPAKLLILNQLNVPIEDCTDEYMRQKANKPQQRLC